MSASTIVVITGASAGLGKALAHALLAPDTHMVTLSRSSDTELAQQAARLGAVLHQLRVDLANPAAAQRAAAQSMNSLPRAQRAVLVNNAGMLGPIEPASQLHDAARVTAAFSLNVTAPMILTAAFLRATQDICADRRIVNISSGAGRNPTAGWAVYCATKAALDHYTRVLAQENPRVRVASLAPGVVDTGMQETIRGTDPANFPDRNRFIALHSEGRLATPQDTAARIAAYIDHDDFGRTVVDDLRNFN